MEDTVKNFHDGEVMIDHELDQIEELMEATERVGLGTLKTELECIHWNLTNAKQRMRNAFTAEIKRK